MNLEEAELFAKIANHVRGVDEMNSKNSLAGQYDGLCCFIGEAVRAGIVDDFTECEGQDICAHGMSPFFGITESEAWGLSIGDYATGPECYEIAKRILSNYGYEHLLREDVTINPEVMK